MVEDFDKFEDDIDKRLDSIEQNYKSPPKMKFFSKLKLILFQPKKFYEKIKEKEANIFGALKYIIIFLAIFSIFRTISEQHQYASSMGEIIMLPFQSFFMWAFCFGLIISLFILTGVLHLIVKMVGGKSKYYQTFKAFVYGLTPILLIGWIPNVFVLITILLYSVTLQIVGISKLQEISYWKAISISIWLPAATSYLFNFLIMG